MEPQQIRELAEALINEGFGLTWWIYVAVFVVSLVGSFAGAYLKVRGEAYAASQDFERILDEQKRTTRELESIRSAVSEGAFLRNQSWLQRRDIYFDLIAKLNAVADGFWEVTVVGFKNDETKTDNTTAAKLAAQKLETALDDLMRVTGPAHVFLGEEAIQALHDYKQQSSKLSAKLGGRAAPRTYFEQQKALADHAYDRLTRAAKNELMTSA